jgi:hypothetical protein
MTNSRRAMVALPLVRYAAQFGIGDAVHRGAMVELSSTVRFGIFWGLVTGSDADRRCSIAQADFRWLYAESDFALSNVCRAARLEKYAPIIAKISSCP